MNCRQMILGLASALLLVGPAVLLAAELRTVPLVLNKGGTKEQPAVFDGRGMTIDLAIDVTVNPEFAQCTWLGVVSYATVKMHFYVDNVRLERLP